jgi:hypothetical protein
VTPADDDKCLARFNSLQERDGIPLNVLAADSAHPTIVSYVRRGASILQIWTGPLGQKVNGSWVNENQRWLEGDPNLVTSYALLVLSYCKGAN